MGGINVIMIRKVSPDMYPELKPFLVELRQLAVGQKGYIGGRTFMNVEDNNDIMVIGTWMTKEDWYSWYNNNKRKELQACVDALLVEPTTYKVYESISFHDAT